MDLPVRTLCGTVVFLPIGVIGPAGADTAAHEPPPVAPIGHPIAGMLLFASRRTESHPLDEPTLDLRIARQTLPFDSLAGGSGAFSKAKAD